MGNKPKRKCTRSNLVTKQDRAQLKHRGGKKGGWGSVCFTFGRAKRLELPPNTVGLAQGGWKLRGGGG